MTAEKFDVYSHVTNQIIAQIEAGTPPWRKPWTGSGAGVSLPERFNVFTLRTLTSKIDSTASRISGLDASGCTTKVS